MYELNRVELPRDVFVWAYERSCRRYVAIKESFLSPTLFVCETAKPSSAWWVNGAPRQIDTRAIRRLAEPLVPPADLGEFVGGEEAAEHLSEVIHGG